MTEALERMESTELDFSNPGVRKAVREAIQSKAIAEFPHAFNRLLEISRSEDDRSALAAIRILGEMGGFIRNKSQVDVKITFDDLRKRGSGDDPLSSLFDIKGAVEAEVEEEVADDYEEREAGQ